MLESRTECSNVIDTDSIVGYLKRVEDDPVRAVTDGMYVLAYRTPGSSNQHDTKEEEMIRKRGEKKGHKRYAPPAIRPLRIEE